MRRSSTDSRDDGGSVAGTVALAICAAILPPIVMGSVSSGRVHGGFGWKGTLTEGYLLTYCASGVLVGLVVGNLLRKWRWAVGMPLIAGLFLVPAGCGMLVGASFNDSGLSNRTPWFVMMGLVLALAAGPAVVGLLSLAGSAKTRQTVSLAAVALLIGVIGYCHVRGAMYLSRANREVEKPIAEWVNTVALASPATPRGPGFIWFGLGSKPYTDCEDAFGGTKLELRIAPEKGPGSLEGVNVPVTLPFDFPVQSSREADMSPAAVQQLLCDIGLKPELAMLFQPGPDKTFVAQRDGFTWKMRGSTATQLLDGYGAKREVWMGVYVSTAVTCSASGLKPGVLRW